jgi:hypothetical protein
MTDGPTLPDWPVTPEQPNEPPADQPNEPPADQPAVPPLAAGDLPTSYAEKYRGTPRGRPEPPPPAPTSSGGPPWLIIAGLAVIAVAVAGLVVLATTSPGSLPGQAAATTPAPGGSGTGISSVASPTPSPTLDPGKVVAARFWTLISDPKASYHMAASGRSVINKKTFETFKESIDVVGDTYSGWIDSSVSPKAKIARKDGVIWVKVPGKARVGRQTSERYFRLTPFLYLEMAAWLDYVKPVTVNGRHLHLLRSNKYYRPDIARMLDFSKFLVVPDKMVLDVYVTDDGVPVSAVFTADVVVGHGTNRQDFHGRTAFTFTKFGAKLKITVPKR